MLLLLEGIELMFHYILDNVNFCVIIMFFMVVAASLHLIIYI